jgi:hypothetical protein
MGNDKERGEKGQKEGRKSRRQKGERDSKRERNERGIQKGKEWEERVRKGKRRAD